METKNKLTLFSRVIIAMIRAYQLIGSPWVGLYCRFEPTCSEYMCQAIQNHGLFKGVYMGIKRLFRCHPWGGHGYDPIIAKSTKTKN